MRKPALTIVLAAALLLGACTTANQYSGINYGHVQFTPDENNVLQISDILIAGGKEQETISVSFELPDGKKFNYTASGVKAFEGQKFRADLEAKLAEEFTDFGSETIGAIADVVVKAIVPGL